MPAGDDIESILSILNISAHYFQEEKLTSFHSNILRTDFYFCINSTIGTEVLIFSISIQKSYISISTIFRPEMPP